MSHRSIILATLLLASCGRIDFDESGCVAQCVAPQTCGGGSAPDACGTSYYVAAIGGSDAASGRTPQDPWATFAHAWTVLTPGDALNLLDGTYTEPLEVLISGQLGSPIGIRAFHDGGALIDGAGVNEPCRVIGTAGALVSDLVVEGIQCANSSDDVFSISYAQRVTVRRVSAHDAFAVGFRSVFSIDHSHDLLLADVAGWGSGLFAFRLYAVDHSVLRRCWGRWDSSTSLYNEPVDLDGSSDNIIENCVATSGPSAGHAILGFELEGTALPSDRNRLLGDIAVGGFLGDGYILSSDTVNMTGNQLIDSVSIGNVVALFQRSDSDLRLDRVTFAETSNGGVDLLPNGTEPPGFEMHADVRNTILYMGPYGLDLGASPFITSLTHSYNDLFAVATPYTNTAADATELAIDPGFDTATYGNGAYLIGSSALATASDSGARVGAQVLYDYVDGKLNTEPLWPWPMEDRILREAGTSVTWEAQGGLWKTLSGVYL